MFRVKVNTTSTSLGMILYISVHKLSKCSSFSIKKVFLLDFDKMHNLQVQSI